MGKFKKMMESSLLIERIDYLDTDNYFKDIELEIFKPEVKDYFTTLQHI